MEQDEGLTFAEVAQELGCSREWVRKLVQRGKLRVRDENTMQVGRRVFRLIRRSEVERYRGGGTLRSLVPALVSGAVAVGSMLMLAA